MGLGFFYIKKQNSIPTPSESVPTSDHNLEATNDVTKNTAEEQTKNWKTYSGSGISFKYPPEYVEQPSQVYGGGNIPEQHFVDSKNKILIWFRVQDNINPDTRKPLFTDVQDLCGCNRAGTVIMLDNQPAASVGNDTLFFFNPSKTKQYNFQITGPDVSTNIEIFKKVLLTFKFTD